MIDIGEDYYSGNYHKHFELYGIATPHHNSKIGELWLQGRL